MKAVYERRPFKVKNAEEYDFNSIVNLFVNPVGGPIDCFEYENSIIKGRMGSGKTMLLKANYVFYLYSIVPTILANSKLTLPVYLRLSDFQHLRCPDDVYNAIIIRIIEELSSVYLNLQDSFKLAQMHKGMQSIPTVLFEHTKLHDVLNELTRLGANEYIEKISTSLGLNAKIKHTFIEMSSKYNKDKAVEIRSKKQPGISDVFSAYEALLKDTDGNILLLIDEVGSIDRSFFSKDKGTSYFEILMNQLRTAEYIRTKIAVYPHSYSDILVETRYGNLILLDNNIINTDGYNRFRAKCFELINKYLNINSDKSIEITEIFDVDVNDLMSDDCLEQLIYASGGNTRRLIQLLDIVMKEAYADHLGTDKVRLKHVSSTLEKHSTEMENLYYDNDIDLINKIAAICKRRKTYKFQFPYKSPILAKYTSKSEEQNILLIAEAGTGRKGNIYQFDYSYCVAKEIPTHHLNGSDKIDKSRARKTGNWARNIAHISEDLLESAGLPGKIEGTIQIINDKVGSIKGEDGYDYFLMVEEIVLSDKASRLEIGRKVRFLPIIESATRIAYSIEVI
jgi:hypothetical protein